jgi:hypothetical protein
MTGTKNNNYNDVVGQEAAIRDMASITQVERACAAGDISLLRVLLPLSDAVKGVCAINADLHLFATYCRSTRKRECAEYIEDLLREMKKAENRHDRITRDDEGKSVARKLVFPQQTINNHTPSSNQKGH